MKENGSLLISGDDSLLGAVLCWLLINWPRICEQGAAADSIEIDLLYGG